MRQMTDRLCLLEAEVDNFRDGNVVIRMTFAPDDTSPDATSLASGQRLVRAVAMRPLLAACLAQSLMDAVQSVQMGAASAGL
jgi:hypothetical protein